VRVRDRRPSYLIGLGFDGLDDRARGELESLLAEIDGVGALEGPA